MSVLVTSMINDAQTLDSVSLPAWGRQLRARRTSALTTAETAKKVQIVDVDSADLTIQEEVPVTTDTLTAVDSCELMIVKPAGTIAVLTVNLPQAPYDGQRFRLATTQVVTALTMAVAGGQTLDGALSAGTVNGFGEWCYSLADKTWYRIG